MATRPMALLIDVTMCVGCRECMARCMEIHDFPGDADEVEDLSATAYTAMVETEDEWFVRKMCRHCVDPSCASVCPVAALEKTAEGPVVYDAKRCIGCRYCIQACPYGVPRYEWDDPVPAVAKCDMCIDRIRAGQEPGCAEACRFGATVFGDREELIAEAHERIEEYPEDYFPHVYGEHDIGGTSVLLLSPIDLEAAGLLPALGTDPLPMLTEHALEKIPGVVVVGGALMLALTWLTRRREEVARAEALEAQARAAAQEAEARPQVRAGALEAGLAAGSEEAAGAPREEAS